jgi:hypothetical protein
MKNKKNKKHFYTIRVLQSFHQFIFPEQSIEGKCGDGFFFYLFLFVGGFYVQQRETSACCEVSTEKMPCLNISTNVNLDGVNTSAILSEASSQVAKIIKKPESVRIFPFASDSLMFFFIAAMLRIYGLLQLFL